MLKKWIHICISLDSGISLYVEGKPIPANSRCQFSGSSKLTSRSSYVTLGSNPYVKKPIDGMIADTRLYSRSLTAEMASEIQKFSDSLDYVLLIDPADVITLPAGVAMRTMEKKAFSLEARSTEWLFIKERADYAHSIKTCKRFGGDILSQDEAIPELLIEHMIYALSEFLLEIWIKVPNKCTSAAISPVSVIPSEMKCEQQLMFICSIPKTVKYTFKGFTHVPTPLSMNPISYSFDAPSNFQLKYMNGMLAIVEPFDQKIVMETTDITPLSEIIGRKNSWISATTSSGSHMSFAITTCNDNQFTCDNGQCIDLKKVCDYRLHCEDFTDEHHCNVTQKRPNYYKNEVSGKMPLDVSITIDLKRIIEVNMEENTLQMEFLFTALWKDSRLTFHNLHRDKTVHIPKDDIPFFWQPNIKLEGVVYEDIYKFSLAKNPDTMYVKATKDGVPAIFYDTEGRFQIIFNYHQDKMFDFISCVGCFHILCVKILEIYPLVIIRKAIIS